MKVFLFQSGTSSNLTTDTAGSINIWSDQPITGKIQRVAMIYNDTTSTGSICIRESGTGIELIRKDGFAATADFYPRSIICGSNSTAASVGASGGNYWEATSTALPFKFEAKGCGNTKSINGVMIFYE